MGVDGDATESHALRGAIDVTKLDAFRDVFLAIEPMASGALDDRINPRELHLTVPYGVGDAAETEFTVRWTTVGDYNIHYADSAGRNLRWDRHPHGYTAPADDRHFHPPPNASRTDERVSASCIEWTRIQLVARAVHLLWRQALDEGSVDSINSERNPP